MTAEYPTRVLLVEPDANIRIEWQVLLGDITDLWLFADSLLGAKNSARINKPDLIIYSAQIAAGDLSSLIAEFSIQECCQLIVHTKPNEIDYELIKTGVDIIQLPDQHKLFPSRARHLLSEKAFVDLVENSLLGHIDPLSGLFNRRMLYDLGEKELNRCSRHGRPFSLVIIKIEDLKEINTNFGLQAGDSLINQLSRLILRSIRQSDMLARIGDKEFIILFPECHLDQCRTKAMRLVKEIDNLHPEYASKKLPFSITSGVAELDTGDILLEQIIQRADLDLGH